MEIGCGIGLFAKVASVFGSYVIATDYKQSVLDLTKVITIYSCYVQINTSNCSNVEYRLLDLMSDSAYDIILESEKVDLVVAGDMIYDEVLTECMCRVYLFYLP